MSEEVDRILTLYTGKTGMHLDVVKRELSEAGVVIKKEGELPSIFDVNDDTISALEYKKKLVGYTLTERI